MPIVPLKASASRHHRVSAALRPQTQVTLASGVQTLDHDLDKYPWYDVQTLYSFDEAGVKGAVSDGMVMRTVKSTIVPWPELLKD